MHCHWQIGPGRSVALLTVFGLCACAAQSYYNPYAYRRAAYSSYNGYNALQPRQGQRQQQLTNPYATYARPQPDTSSTNSAYSRPLSDYIAPTDASGSNSSTSYSDSAYNRRLAARRARLQAVASSNDIVTSSNTQRQPQDKDNAERAGKYRVSKADAENAKFAGALNQETEDESPKTLALLQRKRRNRCSLFGRNAAAGSVTPPPKEQSRFLWDVNVYNVYPNRGGYPFGDGGGGGYPFGGGGGGLLSDGIGGGCGGLGGFGGLGGALGGALGGGLGGGLLSDPVPPAYPAPPLNTFLSLFAPGILQNALAATARPPPLRPQLQADPGEIGDLTSDPDVDPGYNPPARPALPVRRPNRIYYDSPGASPITPAQLVGGVATTVNGIIQQLTGNVQPVYPSYRRAYNTGK